MRTSQCCNHNHKRVRIGRPAKVLRNELVRVARASGASLKEIADMFHISEGRVSVLCREKR